MATQYLLILENLDTFQLENGDDFQLDLGANISMISLWKGAIEPSQVSSSGNQLAMFKGAVEPAYIAPSSGTGFFRDLASSLSRSLSSDLARQL